MSKEYSGEKLDPKSIDYKLMMAAKHSAFLSMLTDKARDGLVYELVNGLIKEGYAVPYEESKY